MLQGFLLRQLLAKQLQSVPPDKREKLLAMLEANPDFFKKLADEIATRVKAGEEQMSAAMAVMSVHKDQLKELFGE
jgi:hypothetical protein